MPEQSNQRTGQALTPHIVVRNGAAAIEFYKKAFGFEEIARHTMPDGKAIMHCELRLGDSTLFLGEEMPNMGDACRSPQSLGGTPVTLHINSKDVDKAFARAVAAGGKVTMPLADMFWGDRYGQLTDPFGHQWALSTHKEDVSPQELQKRAAAMFAKKK